MYFLLILFFFSGHGDEESQSLPCKVKALIGKIVTIAEAGCEHSAAITLDGQVSKVTNFYIYMYWLFYYYIVSKALFYF